MKTIRIMIALLLIIAIVSGCTQNIIPVPSTDSSEQSDSQSGSSEGISSQSESESHSESSDGNEYIDPSTIVIEWIDGEKRTSREMFSNELPPVEKNTDWEPEDSIPVYGKYQDSFPIVTNNTPLEKMVSEIEDEILVISPAYGLPFLTPAVFYDIEEIRNQRSLQTSYLNISEACVHGDSYIYRLPVNFLRQMDVDGWYYTVAKFNNGYVYYIYGPMLVEDQNGEYVNESSDYSDVYFYGAVYSESIRSYNDFKSIKVGSSISDVIKVDSSAVITLAYNRFEQKIKNQEFYRTLRSILLLTDGILEITYEPEEIVPFDYYGQTAYKPDGDNLTVCNIEYYPDFNYSPKNSGSVCDMTEYFEKAVIPIHIYPYDYPSE